jgi:hypothetical protein
MHTNSPASTRGERRRRGAPRAAVMLAAAVAVTAAVQLVVASTASAIDGWERRTFGGHHNDQPYKINSAQCSSTSKRLVGGGAFIDDGDRKRVRLVGLIPQTSDGQFPDTFTVIAEAPDLFSNYDWHVTAYIICVDADEVPDHQIVPDWVDVPSTGGPFAHTSARCPSGTIAYSAGGQVVAGGHGTFSHAAGRIGLQMNRTSRPQDISRIAARERSELTTLPWTLASYAVCAEPPATMKIRGAENPGDGAIAYCDKGWDVIGPGGGGGLIDGGPVWLQSIQPLRTQGVHVRMTGPLRPSIGGMVAHMSCAT